VFKYPGRDVWFEPLIYYRQNSMEDSRLDINMKMDVPTFNEDFSLWGIIAYRRALDHEFGMSLGAATTIGINYRGLNVGSGTPAWINLCSGPIWQCLYAGGRIQFLLWQQNKVPAMFRKGSNAISSNWKSHPEKNRVYSDADK
jgi:hypothetical protein